MDTLNSYLASNVTLHYIYLDHPFVSNHLPLPSDPKSAINHPREDVKPPYSGRKPGSDMGLIILDENYLILLMAILSAVNAYFVTNKQPRMFWQRVYGLNRFTA